MLSKQLFPPLTPLPMCTPHSRLLFVSTFLVLALSLLTTDTVHAQDFRVSVDQLKEASTSVVLARTVKTESHWNSDGSAILTRVTLQVEDRLMGEASDETILVIPGGRIGNTIHEVSDMPSFVANEESIIFVERHSSGVNVVSGGSSGKLQVKRNQTTRAWSVVGGAALFDRVETGENNSQVLDEGASSDGDDKSLPLDEFKRRLLQR